MKILHTISLVVDLIIVIIITLVFIQPISSAPPTTRKPSGNMATRTRYFDSSGKMAGSKRTYNYSSSRQSYYYNRNGIEVGRSYSRKPK